MTPSIACRHRFLPRGQRGVSLFLGLMVLLVLTLLALAVIQVVTMQERMSRNLRDSTIAFQAAEAALRAGEQQINAGTATGDPFNFSRFSTACTTNAGLCVVSNTGTPVWTQIGTWTSANSQVLASANFTVPSGVAQPRYIIELISGRPVFDASTGCSPAMFRISSRGFGQNKAVVNLQSLYRYRVNNC